MKQIELYINQQLCDIGNPKDFSVYLKRQFISPAELSNKDTQRSYDITLPASPVNNAIFDYLSTEEVKGKFATLYPAQLIIGGVKILDGNFKLTEVSTYEYKGLLGTPPSKTIKEIFGDKTMNKAGSLLVDFSTIDKISEYNESEGVAGMRFFFPLVMYGLLPKVPQTTGLYGGKGEIGDNVRFGLDDFPPSLNCLDVMKNIFKSHELNLTGSAFSDDRLNKLYMSYKNPVEFDMPWNYGDFATIKLKGKWDNCHFLAGEEGQKNKKPKLFETTGFLGKSDGNERGVYTCDLLNSTNLKSLDVTEDLGQNVTHYSTHITDYKVDNKLHPRVKENYSILIPMSGYYKISLKGSIHLPRDRENDPNVEFRYSRFWDMDKNTGYRFASADLRDDDDYLNDKRFELKLLRNRGEEAFNWDKIAIDGVYYENNQGQKQKELKETNSYPDKTAGYSYPPMNIPVYAANNPSDFKPNQTVFVDPAQNDNLVIGLSWGAFEQGQNKTGTPLDGLKENNDHHVNRSKNALWARTLAAKSKHSWNSDYKDNKLSHVLVHHPVGYTQYVDLNQTEGGKANIVTQETNQHKMILTGSPVNYIRRGYHKGAAKAIATSGSHKDNPINWYGDGEMNAIAWFEKGERLTIASSSDTAGGGDNYWIWHKLDFDLSIEPYRRDKGWAQINEFTGSTVTDLSWNDPVIEGYAFPKDKIDVIKFLPSEVKVDEWIENFCKAFNLELTRHDENNFELNVKKKMDGNTSLILDLDQKANVNVSRQNAPFGLPKAYEIGFTVDKDEIGYKETTRRFAADGSYIKDPMDAIKEFEGDDGGGRIETGSTETSIVQQTSNFSHNWMKEIKSKGDFYKDGVFPIISDKEAWEPDSSDYGEMMMKSYMDKAQRFWYKDSATYNVKINDRVHVKAGVVTDSYKGNQQLTLHYKDQPNSILRNYFMVFADAQNCYTQVECYLSPQEYDMLDRCLIRFNGDLYHVAEVEGYDPMGMRKTTLKLIRKIL